MRAICGWLLPVWAVSGGVLAQSCPATVVVTAPDSRYELLNGGHEVKDMRTGLIWQRCSLGQAWDGAACSGAAVRHTWRQGLEAAAAAGPGWSLPNIRELRSLVERGCFSTAMNAEFFPGTPTSVGSWSSTTVAGYGGIYALAVDFTDGSGNGRAKNDTAFVRLVRSVPGSPAAP